MEELDFFEGKRPLRQVSFIMNEGKTTLDCIMSEEWHMIEPTPFTLKCNNKRDRKITQKFGFEKTSSESFESNIGGSIGLKGIASLESRLKEVVGEEIKFYAGTELEDTFHFDSPECGYKVVKLFQKARSLFLKYEDSRYWHRRSLELPLTQWLRPIYDGSYQELYDPSCNCKKRETSERPGVACRVTFPGFSKLAVFWEDTQQLQFADGTESLNDYFNTTDGNWIGDIPARVLSDYLLFLTGTERGEILQATAIQEPLLFPMLPENYDRNAPRITLGEEFKMQELQLNVRGGSRMV